MASSAPGVYLILMYMPVGPQAHAHTHTSTHTSHTRARTPKPLSLILCRRTTPGHGLPSVCLINPVTFSWIFFFYFCQQVYIAHSFLFRRGSLCSFPPLGAGTRFASNLCRACTCCTTSVSSYLYQFCCCVWKTVASPRALTIFSPPLQHKSPRPT